MAQPWLRMRTLATLALLAAYGNVSADDSWIPVSAARLDALRGGFTTPEGLHIAIGIERVVSINGEQVVRTVLAAGAPMQLDTGLLFQSGARNEVAASLLQAGATVVQNSLSNQTISTHTIVTASLNSASLLRDLNFQQSLVNAAIASARLN